MANDFPTGSVITSVTPSVDAGTAVDVLITRPDPAYTHTLVYAIGARSQTFTDVAETHSFVVPVDWCDALPAATSGTATVTLTTYNGAAQVGQSTTRSFTLTVPASVVPVPGAVAAVPVNNDVPPAWGVFVQNHSGVQATITDAAGVYGSTITSYRLDVGGVLLGTAASVTRSEPLRSAGTLTVTGTITDSRGRTASVSTPITVEAYARPALTDVLLERGTSTGAASANGTYGRLLPTFAVSSVGGRNTSTQLVEYRLRGSGTWTGAGSFSSGVVTAFGGGNLVASATYDVRVTVSDSIAAAQWVGVINAAGPLVDFKAGGTGVAIGKIAVTDNLLEVDLPAQFNKAVAIAKPAWTAAILGNSWANYNTGFAPARWVVDALGWVQLDGLIRSGTINAAAFTLPVGARPEYNVILLGETYGGGTGRDEATCRINVNADGTVVPAQGSNATWVSLSGLRFRAA